MRRQAREIALQILFQTEFSPQITVTSLLELFGENGKPEMVAYAEELIQGVQSNKAKIDALIQQSSAHWKIDRMSTVDRNVMRIATFEIVFATNPIRPNIVLDEAIEISKKYGTTDSGSFVNGVLDQVVKRI